MKVFTSIRSVLSMAFCLSLLLPVLAISLYGHFFTGEALVSRVLQDSQAEAALQAAHLDYALESLATDARYLGMLPAANTWQNQQEDENLRSALESDMLIFVAANPQIHRLHWLNQDGRPLISIGSDSRSVYPINANERRLLNDGGYFGETMRLSPREMNASFGRSDDASVLLFRLRFDDSALIFEVYASWVLRQLNDTSQVWAVLDSQGRHLLYPQTTSFEGAIAATDEALAPYLGQLEDSSGAILLAQSIFSYSRFEAYAGETWLLYQQRPSAEVFAASQFFNWSSGAIVLTGMVLSLAVGAILASYLLRPIVKLKQDADNFAIGVLPAETPRHAIAELDALRKSFHRMALDLNEENQEKRKLISKLIDAQEEERKRIAYDLHDGLLQQLVGARLHLAMAAQTSQNGIKVDLERGSVALSEAIIEGRRILQGLHPTILDDLGLEDALSELAQQQAELYAWDLDLDIHRLPKQADKSTAVTVFRIAQEAFNNIGKHAKASEVRVQLRNGTGIQLCIADNGQGFDVASLNGNGLGVNTMRERAELLAGHCEISSSCNEGTKIEIYLPYQV